jgi:hypothetical protein
MDQVRWVGYHGTSEECARSICLQGYRLSGETNWFGVGVYFFHDLDPGLTGNQEAQRWCRNARRYKRWAVLKSHLCAAKANVFDLLSSPKARDQFVKLRDVLLAKHEQNGNERGTFTDRVVYTHLANELDIHLVRALVNCDKRWDIPSPTVTFPQVFVCAKNVACIRETAICATGTTQ